MKPPGETYTFLFTDIEGSTRLWEHHPEVMRHSLARHDALMRAAIEGCGGRVFKTVGDAFCAVFPSAAAGVAATLAAQQALAAEPWPPETLIRVRMALHTGPAEVRDRDYFGPTLNRVARILSTGHGGQVLLSRATAAAVAEALPGDAALAPMGSHKLKDLLDPEELAQLNHPALATDFPPLKSLSVLPTNLPAQLTSFIGRQKEMADIRGLLERSRLLTLTGPGGAGKTRLSLQVGAEVLDHYPQGVWLVELAALEDPDQTWRAVAQALRVKDEPHRQLEESVIDAVQGKRLLLILDNCEHLVAACAQVAERLLRACPKLTLLASSREPLHIAGEQVYLVPSLGLPGTDRRSRPEMVLRSEAVRLFADRAALHQPDFAVNEQNARAVSQICRRLDGIPLALELAAARVKVLPAERILERLDDRFRLLTTGSRTALPRQQTLRALIDWSYELLNEEERRLFRRLAAFSGGWSLEAAEAICGLDSAAVLDLTDSLVQKSLVLLNSENPAEPRYRMLETIRQYARDRLRESGEFEAVRARHRDYFVAYAESAAPELTGPHQSEWFTRLERENDNLCSAMACCEESKGEGNAALCLAGALGFFWRTRGRQSDARRRLESALRCDCGHGPTLARARALTEAGQVATDQGDLEAAARFHGESLEIRRALNDESGAAASLNYLGVLARIQGDAETSQRLLEESLALLRRTGNRHEIAGALNSLGSLALAAGQYELAVERYEEAISLRRELGDQTGLGVSLGNLGITAIAVGDFEQARCFFAETMALSRDTGDHGGIAFAAHYLGELARRRGDFDEAKELLRESLRLAQEAGAIVHQAFSTVAAARVCLEEGDLTQGEALAHAALELSTAQNDRRGVVRAWDALGEIASAHGDQQRAARHWQDADTEREALGILLTPTERAERSVRR